MRSTKKQEKTNFSIQPTIRWDLINLCCIHKDLCQMYGLLEQYSKQHHQRI